MNAKRTRRFGSALVLAVSGILASTPLLWAHDLWLAPNALNASPDAHLEVLGRLGATSPVSAGPARPAPVGEARTAGRLSDSTDVLAVAERFHASLAAGDSGAALALLAPDVTILESGGTETLADYRAHHLSADIEYSKAVPSQRTVTLVRVIGDVAWVSATSTTQGEFRGRPVNSAGAELMVLSREKGTWKIRAIHWSSRRRTP